MLQLSNVSHDFITFKVNLYKEEAAKDPIRKSEIIKEVVSSISKIPDPIKRSVYLQESSRLLEIDEAILIAEQNKLLLKKNKEKRHAKEDTEDVNLEHLQESLEEKSKINDDDIITLQERESIRLLINYGFNEIEEEYHLYDYLLEELEGISFTSPVYREILDIFKEKLAEGKVIDADYLIKNGNEQIKSLVIDLVTDKYEVSPLWESKYNIYIPKESEILKNVIYTNILRLKLRVIRKLIKENMNELQQADSEEKQSDHMKIHAELKKSEMEIAGTLGNVVIR